jgi:hypothetical protein
MFCGPKLAHFSCCPFHPPLPNHLCIISCCRTDWNWNAIFTFVRSSFLFTHFLFSAPFNGLASLLFSPTCLPSVSTNLLPLQIFAISGKFWLLPPGIVRNMLALLMVPRAKSASALVTLTHIVLPIGSHHQRHGQVSGQGFRDADYASLQVEMPSEYSDSESDATSYATATSRRN